MLKRMLALGVVLAVGGGLAGCVVEDAEPEGGGGGTVIDRERVIEREAPSRDTDIHVNPPAQQPVQPDTDTRVETERRTTTTTTP